MIMMMKCGGGGFFQYVPEMAGLDIYVKGIVLKFNCFPHEAIQLSFLNGNLTKVLANKTPLVFVWEKWK